FTQIGDFNGGASDSSAHGLNDSGEVVGEATASGNVTDAFYWSQATGEVNLGGLAGNVAASARAINNHHQIVGFSNVPGIGLLGFLATPTGGMTALDSLLVAADAAKYTIVDAEGINDDGVISAQAFYNLPGGGGAYQSVLLVPTPEPPTWLVLGAGVGTLLALLRLNGKRDRRVRLAVVAHE
ncbi:MAG TPA: hypothetical protein VKT78_01805, partial [Fimbriimonadaceae bacterium]|nr:hypothetical protein [Fimbriimonadaceae bacterium]